MGGKKTKEAPKKDRRRSDDFTVTGTALSLVGGAFLGASVPLGWVKFELAETNVFGLIEENFLFITILVAQLLGLAQMVIAAILMRSAGWPAERKRNWSLPLMAMAIIIMFGMAMGIILIELDYLRQGSLYTFGPAPFAGIFGMVFSMTGAILFLLDVKAKQPGPVQRPGKAQPGFRESSVKRQHVRFESSCPKCGADVTDDMAICQECGSLIGSDDKEEDLEEIDELVDDDDIDKVR